MNKKGQTDKFTPYDYADEVERFMAANLDFVLYNTDILTAEVLAKYAADGDTPVEKKRSPPKMGSCRCEPSVVRNF